MDKIEIDQLSELIKNELKVAYKGEFLLKMKRLFFRLHGSPTFPVHTPLGPLIKIKVEKSDVNNDVILESKTGTIVVRIKKVGHVVVTQGKGPSKIVTSILAADVFHYLFDEFAKLPL